MRTLKRVLKRIKYFFEDWWIVVVITIIFLSLIAGLVFALRAWENKEDDDNYSALMQHEQVCGETPELKTSYSSYGKSPTYVYECPKCRRLFEFHDVTKVEEALGEYYENK